MLWTQWNDLDLPARANHLATDGLTPKEEDLPKITFYVPSYMGGKKAIELIQKMPSLKVVQSPNAGVEVIAFSRSGRDGARTMSEFDQCGPRPDSGFFGSGC